MYMLFGAAYFALSPRTIYPCPLWWTKIVFRLPRWLVKHCAWVWSHTCKHILVLMFVFILVSHVLPALSCQAHLKLLVDTENDSQVGSQVHVSRKNPLISRISLLLKQQQQPTCDQLVSSYVGWPNGENLNANLSLMKSMLYPMHADDHQIYASGCHLDEVEKPSTEKETQRRNLLQGNHDKYQVMTVSNKNQDSSITVSVDGSISNRRQI